MLQLSSRAAWVVFIGSVLTLLLLGFAAYTLTARYAASEELVAHTLQVETGIARARADLMMADSSRLAYIMGDANGGTAFSQAVHSLEKELGLLRRLTSDNPSQQARLDAIVSLDREALGLMQQSMAQRPAQNPLSPEVQNLVHSPNATVAAITAKLAGMREEEASLLASRQIISERTYANARVALTLAFVAIVLVLFTAIRSLAAEVRNRKRAESAVRRLSSRILELQDVERRRVARELHDSIGQYFAALLMSISAIKEDPSMSADKRMQALDEARQMAEQGIAETRTLSHLLHPPLLDEAGFASAAQWYVEGFTQRSKIQVALELPANLERLPREMELVLFRVLQEGLTNIHKHSGSSAAFVRLEISKTQVALAIRDKGKGIPHTLLDQFQQSSTGTGIGLAGIRERVRDFGGLLTIHSDDNGTQLAVTLPLAPAPESAPVNSDPDAPQQTGSVRASADRAPEGGAFRILAAWKRQMARHFLFG